MDDIFNLSEVDIDQLPAVGDVAVSGEVVAIPTTDPYWQIPTPVLSTFLQLASLFSWRSGRDLTSKSVSLTLSEDRTTLECRATDFDTFLLHKIPLTGQTPIPGNLIFPTQTLLKLTKLCPKTLVIKQGEGSPSALIMGQWVEIEPIILDPSLYVNTDPVTQSGSLSFDGITSLIPIASSAVVPKDRNISFYSSSIQCTYLWSTIQVKASSPLQFILSSREATLLKSLSGDVQVGVTQSDLPRLSLSTPSTTILVIYRKPEAEESTINIPPFHLEIDPAILHSLVQLSETLPSSSGLLQLQYTDSLVITYCSKLSNTQYSVSSNLQGQPTVLEAESIQTKILKQLLKPLGNRTIKMSWDTTTLYLSSDQATVSIQFES